MFETVEGDYRVVLSRYGGGDSETTIPLGSWRKGGGLAGSRGHVYEHSPGFIGVWWIGSSVRKRFEQLREDFPELIVMQVGYGEGTFRLPYRDLERILPILKAKRRFRASAKQLAAAEKGRSASPLSKRIGFDRRQRAIFDSGIDDRPENMTQDGQAAIIRLKRP